MKLRIALSLLMLAVAARGQESIRYSDAITLRATDETDVSVHSIDDWKTVCYSGNKCVTVDDDKNITLKGLSNEEAIVLLNTAVKASIAASTFFQVRQQQDSATLIAAYQRATEAQQKLIAAQKKQIDAYKAGLAGIQKAIQKEVKGKK